MIMKNIITKLFNMSTQNSNNYKKWTVLIYANGNNDLAPETYKNFQKIKNIFIHEDIQVAVQLALAPYPLVETLRPETPPTCFKPWESGVYRYLFSRQNASLVDVLGNLNMADPRSLADFISWGITNYPAEHIMVILSGHGAGFAGILTEYTYEHPYIMSIEGLIDSISLCKKTTDKYIDCLVLDSCYMNMVELWYEFAMAPKASVKYLITPLKNLGLEGLAWDQIIRQLQESVHQPLSLSETIKKIIHNVNQTCGILNKIMAAQLTKNHFVKLKSAVNQIADYIILNKIYPLKFANGWHKDQYNYPLISLLDLYENLKDDFPAIQSNILEILKNILVYPSLSQLPKNQNLGPSLYLTQNAEQYSIVQKYYENLSFNVHNKWLQLLPNPNILQNCNTKPRKKPKSILPPPLYMPIGSVVAVILEQNPNLMPSQAWQIVKDLEWY